MRKSLLAFGLVSNSALAATEISQDKAEGLTYVGTVNVVVNNGTSVGYISAVNKKADEKNAGYYVIKSMESLGSGNDVSVIAVLYKQ